MKKAWLFRALPNNIDRMKEFKANNLIGVGWDYVEDLSGKDINDIGEILNKRNYKNPRSMSSDKSTLDIIANRMNIGDVVVVPHGDLVYIGEISTDYRYDETKATGEGYPHQRGVNWIGEPLLRNNLTLDLRSSLKVPKTCADLTHRYKDIQIALGEVVEDKLDEKEFITVEYPIRPNVNVKIEIPKDLKKSESVRIGEFIKTIFFDDIED
ncbi:hypothetical protein [Clostridioides sp. ZZV15-6598]|uniref:hypothetical protein n=1 Tax=Clostridioides sp. ZZV15-6598 TaxID=2811501 RepID=UPI001D107579|nr:hypothetical protein [Clostridioides sp. ZZV15-6598]